MVSEDGGGCGCSCGGESKTIRLGGSGSSNVGQLPNNLALGLTRSATGPS